MRVRSDANPGQPRDHRCVERSGGGPKLATSRLGITMVNPFGFSIADFAVNAAIEQVARSISLGFRQDLGQVSTEFK